MSAPLFTVLLPVHRPPALLPFAVESVLGQTCDALELFIICDGAPSATVEAARRFADADRRVRVFAHPKGERHGEAYRALALRQASGRFVCQIGDDDLWFDNHLAEAARLMEVADFGNLVSILLLPDGRATLQLGDLAQPFVRGAMLNSRYNFFGPTASVYRLETYRALPEGWTPAPEGMWTDLFMWRKFLAAPGVRCATRPTPTSVMFPATLRTAMSLDQRREEQARWTACLRDHGQREQLWRSALLDLAAQLLGARRQAFAEARTREAAESQAARLSGALAEIVAAAGDTEAQTRLARAALGPQAS